MGFLKNIFKTDPAREPAALPSGSFTVNPAGEILTSTVPIGFERSRLLEIGKAVVAAFREAKEAELPLGELVINFSAFNLKAREMRGGAMIFLSPRGAARK
jgi:hypothetical protein